MTRGWDLRWEAGGMLNLRIGMGYGSVLLTDLGLVHPTPIPRPEAEVFGRF